MLLIPSYTCSNCIDVACSLSSAGFIVCSRLDAQDLIRLLEVSHVCLGDLDLKSSLLQKYVHVQGTEKVNGKSQKDKVHDAVLP